MLESALAYAAAGRFVFPCLPAAKRPATKGGLKAATTDPAIIRRWWEKHPTMNIGISCGPSRLLVVDLDVKDADGLANWYQVGADHGPWIDTLRVTTPSSGEHWIFTVEPGWGIGNSAGKLGPGIDVRCEGGYIVAAPSKVADGSYTVCHDRPPVPAPDWLVGLLREPVRPRRWKELPLARPADGYGQAALEGELGRLAVAPDGQRNDTLVRCAFRLGQLVVGGALDASDVAGQLHSVALRIGLNDREAERTIASGMGAGMAKPRRPEP